MCKNSAPDGFGEGDVTLCSDFLEDLLLTFFHFSISILLSLVFPHPTPDLMKPFAMSSMYFTRSLCVVLEQFITMINVVTLGKLLI